MIDRLTSLVLRLVFGPDGLSIVPDRRKKYLFRCPECLEISSASRAVPIAEADRHATMTCSCGATVRITLPMPSSDTGD